jgi:hypothetical protein
MNSYDILIGKLEGKKTVDRHRRNQKGNNKTDCEKQDARK